MKKYNVGLDIGTTSVGWAVTEADTQKIIRKGNKRLWGARLFDTANPAADRRNFRSVRRRFNRRRERISLLQEEFKNEINKVDPSFYQKLQDSFLSPRDSENSKIEISEIEKKVLKEYPTIYHLRDKLINTTEKLDIRLVYLAIHHIIKYRGNFLSTNKDFNINNINLKEELKTTFENWNNIGLEISTDLINYSQLETAIKTNSKNDRKVLITKELKDKMDNKLINEFIKLINGNKFNTLNLGLSSEKEELSFDGSDYEDKYSEIEDLLGENIEVLNDFKELYNLVFLKRLFKDSDNFSLSALMINKYNIHRNDLNDLKEILRYDMKKYRQIFRSSDKYTCFYDKYVHNAISNAEFIKVLEETIAEIKLPDSLMDKYITKIQPRMINDQFMPRITDTENGNYPYQLNKLELIKIIENQGKYYPFLLNKIDDTYKIVKLLEFKIPYYVGPLVDESKSEFAWLIKKQDNVRITPYNFDKIVDKDATAEKFIKRMIGHCSYLLEEYSIPNNSILYSKFKVLNELKQIKINGDKISIEAQHDIYNNLFLKATGSITEKKFKDYILSSKDFDMYGFDINITGYSADGKFANNMQSYVEFFGLDGIFNNTNYNLEDAEDIIEMITIFEDKSILERKIRNEYQQLSESGINNIVRKKYKGWSGLSKKLLTELVYLDKETSQPSNIMDLMWNTDKNFMQIINDDKYNFQKKIAECNTNGSSNRINYDLVSELATSPATKRGIYQSLKVLDEIVKYMGDNPKYVSIEMARDDDKKERKVDRKKYITNLYDKFKDKINNYKNLMSEIDGFEKIDSEKLFLYFIQEGKSLYSGTPLNIDLLNTDDYEVDHIIPRTLIKDDSIDNKALVLRKENQEKAANKVLPERFIKQSIKWWEHLKNVNLISSKKFYNLKRTKYSEEDINGFINRQLVETRQITKHVANIVGNLYPESKVIYLKANLSSNYRAMNKLYKFRDLNDNHHAYDAYLAATLGEFKEDYFPKKLTKETIDNIKTTNKDLKYGLVINSLNDEAASLLLDIAPKVINKETGELKFDSSLFNKTLEYNYYCNDVLISKKVEIKTGQFYNQTKNSKGKKGVPLKDNLSTKIYGSYTSLNPAYAVLIKYMKGKNINQKLVGVPIYYLAKSKNDADLLDTYFHELLNIPSANKIEIISKPIPFNSYLIWNKQLCYLIGASDNVEVCNAKEFSFTKDFLISHKDALNKLLKNKKMKLDDDQYSNALNDIINYIVNAMKKKYELYKDLVSKLQNMINYESLNTNSVEEKEQIIIELIKLLKCNSVNANFKFLNDGYSKEFGRIKGKTINNFQIKYVSYTGIKSHIVDVGK